MATGAAYTDYVATRRIQGLGDAMRTAVALNELDAARDNEQCDFDALLPPKLDRQTKLLIVSLMQLVHDLAALDPTAAQHILTDYRARSFQHDTDE